MRSTFCFLLIVSLFAACNSTESERAKKDPASRTSTGEPFDRHATFVLTKHARCRMDCRHITIKEIHEVLDEGTINYTKSEPDAKPDPKYAMEGYTDERQHLRIIVAPEGEKLIVITCIELDVEWTCHCN